MSKNLLDKIEDLVEGQFYCLSENDRILAVTDDKNKIPLIISKEFSGARVTIDKVTYYKENYGYEIEATLLDDGDKEENHYNFTLSTVCKY